MNAQGPARRPDAPKLLTILFTDMESSVSVTQSLGDARAQQLIRAHNTIVRGWLSEFGGHEVKHTGDGILATFRSASGAVECAMAIMRSVAEHAASSADTPFAIHAGLNAGEPLQEERDVFGTAVQIAARLRDIAGPGEILASSVVRDLAAGKTLPFTDRGESTLRGIAAPMRVFAVDWSQSAPAVSTADARHRRLRFRAAVATAAVVCAAAVLGALAIAGAFSGGHAGFTPNYSRMVTHHENSINAKEVTGRCLESDLVVSGDGSGAVTGDITAFERITSFDAVLPVEGRCGTVKSHTSATFSDAAGNSLSYDSEGVSTSRVSRLGTEGKGASSELDRVVVIVTGGSGRYAGMAGKGACTSHTFVANSAPGGDTSLGRSLADCQYFIAPALEAEPLIVEAVGGVANTPSVFGRAAAFPTTIRVIVLYRNARDETFTGVSLRLHVPDTLHVVAEVEGQPEQSSSDLEWVLDDLPGGTLRSFEMVLRVNSATGKPVTLVPELLARQLPQPARSDPVEVVIAP